MSPSHHLRRVFSFGGRSQTSRRSRKEGCPATRHPPQSKPALEALEDRLALSLASSVSAVGGIKDFYIDGGTAWLRDSQGTQPLGFVGAKSISAATDPTGYARAAIVFQNGTLWDYFDEPGPMHGLQFEKSNVLQASAGAGFDAVLYGSGPSGLAEYFDPYSKLVKEVVAFNATQISAGADRDSLPMIAYMDKSNNAYEWRLGTTAGAGYTESLGTANQVSAGQNGVVALLEVTWIGSFAENHYDDAYASYGGAFTTTGTMKWLDGGLNVWIAEVSAGTDSLGMAKTDVLFSGTGQVKEYDDGCGVKNLGTGYLGKGYLEVDAGLGGISDLVEQDPYQSAGWYDIWRFQDWCPTNSGISLTDQWTSLVFDRGPQ
jgi:hypothetical protein